MPKSLEIQSTYQFAGIVLICATIFALCCDLSHAAPIVAKDSVRKTCEELNDYRENTGVTDNQGKNHPGYAGWTTSAVTYSQYAYDYTGSNKNGQLCLEATLKPNRKMFSVSNNMTRLDWQQPGKLSKECRAEKNRWEKAVENHEKRHATDNDEIIRQFNKAWFTVLHKYSACANTENQAKEDIENQIKVDLMSQVKMMEEEIQQVADKYHNTAEGAAIENVDCSKCKNGQRTYCPCDNPSQGKPRNYATEAECAVKCPTGLKCFSAQCTTPP